MPHDNDEPPIADRKSFSSRFSHNPSDLFLRAVAILRALADAQGEGAVVSAFGAVVADSREAAYAETTQVHERGYDLDKPFWTLKDLIVDPHKREEFLERVSKRELTPDHTSYWTTDEGTPGTCVSQPYRLSWGELCRMVDLCREFGLQMNIDASHSWHAPGQTLLVEIRRQRAPTPDLFRML